MLAAELHALKTELQSTLARLGIDPISSDDDAMSPKQERRTRRTSAYITALQQQRQEILRQMEQGTAIEEDHETELEGATQQNRQTQGFPMGNSEAVPETHYSIGGVVTLEPLSSSQQLQVSSTRSEVSFQPVAAAPVIDPTSIPLKFAETMLKLEKSVQMRDQLLHHGSFSKRRTTRTREENDQIRRRGRQLQRRRRSESGSNSDSKHWRTGDSVPARFVEEESHRTPTTGSSVTTPTTGSDQKSAASSSKQVRFGDDAYSTPVIARKFNFDGPSIDDDEDEVKHEETESVLSFLGGSSVTSAELNDASFLRAFERFRCELQVSRHDGALQFPSQPPLARKLFPPPNATLPSSNSNEAVDAASHKPEEPHNNTVTAQPGVNDNPEAFPALIGLSVQELQERRRQLCLDIQAESAQLVLSFGAMQNASSGSQDKEQMKFRLLELRDELKAVDGRLNTKR
ncbi:Hypothetical protein PHPALM_6893 [Phytophthora palmivora]|uniref:Uncharacterized protein n=1 Tax=Phytophthora palmivora TaxID=4796 RepID=A0A2P4YDM5_9STRA|nr:Hypothetical protein PHPALM_6893 [Phytophthora palmivora]